MSSKKSHRDPNAPKRNQSAYLLYQNAMRDTFKLQNPGMTFGQLAKYTSAMYAEMPTQEKEAWAQRAEADKARYLHELSQYVPPPGYDVKGDAIAGSAPSMRSSKSGKATRDPNAPKKNMSAYLMYQNTMRESFRTENPGMTFGQLAKFTSAMYKSLTPEEKARWEEAALQDKARYEAEMANYIPPPGFDPTGQLVDSSNVMSGGRKYNKKQKDPNAPKRARGSYVFFTLDERPKIVKENPEMKFTETGHVMGERWRALTPEDKKKYEDLANNDKKRFNDEMAAYNAQKQASLPEPAPAPAYAHPQYQEAQQYAEQYYAQHDAAAAAAAAAHYDPNAAYAQYYATQGYPPQQPPDNQYHYA
ncbi:hypothetical protein ACHAXR_011129 [Thalassiosira sp. AJA248-18]